MNGDPALAAMIYPSLLPAHQCHSIVTPPGGGQEQALFSDRHQSILPQSGLFADQRLYRPPAPVCSTVTVLSAFYMNLLALSLSASLTIYLPLSLLYVALYVYSSLTI